MTVSIPNISSQKSNLTTMFNGNLGCAFFCAKSEDEYFLFRKSIDRGEKQEQAIDSIKGWRINDDLTWNTEKNFFEKGHFFELRLFLHPASITFETGTKVLALKPTSNGLFSIKFYPATIISGAKTCERKFKNGLSLCNRPRHEYEVKFDDEKEKTYNVYEELIVPLEKHWGNIKDKYSAEDNGSDDDQASEEKKGESSSSEEESQDSSTGEEEEKRRRHHHKHHKHHKHSRKERKHRNEPQPSIIIIPIVIPYGNITQQIPYFY